MTTPTVSAPTPTPDLDLVFCEHHPDVLAFMENARIADETARKAAFDSAKTVMGQLWALGIVCTPDDEEDRARAYEFRRNLSAALDLPQDQIEDGLRTFKAADSLIRALRCAVEEMETRKEADEAAAAVINAVHPIPGCTHRSRKPKLGLWGAPWSGVGALVTGRAVYRCSRCGTETSRFLPTMPTPGSVAARAKLIEIAEHYELQVENRSAILLGLIARRAADARVEDESDPNPRIQARHMESAFYRLRWDLDDKGLRTRLPKALDGGVLTVGTWVELVDGRIGLVTESHPYNVPVVRLPTTDGPGSTLSRIEPTKIKAVLPEPVAAAVAAAAV